MIGIGAPIHTRKPERNEKTCYGCMGKGEYKINLSTGKYLGPYKCETCKGTGKLKK